ncbi:MAG: hypothetical protein GY796_10370 [Chloroflexi bacterium]|nr:hypothetical protein [Chloroflexota bacterium]
MKRIQLIARAQAGLDAGSLPAQDQAEAYLTAICPTHKTPVRVLETRQVGPSSQIYWHCYVCLEWHKE